MKRRSFLLPVLIDLGFRMPALRGYRVGLHGITGPSGTFYEHLPTEASAREFLREFARRAQAIDPETYALLRKLPLVEAMRRMVEAAATGRDEEPIIGAVTAWLTAESYDLTWATIAPEGLS